MRLLGNTFSEPITKRYYSIFVRQVYSICMALCSDDFGWARF